jgi:DNA-binding response OmpR family regulator
MEPYNFEDVRVVICEANREIRSGVKAALRDHGFGNVYDTGSLGAVHESVDKDEVDLLICDTGLGLGEICDLTYRIRHHEFGSNPFILVMTISSDPTHQAVDRIIESGADDLLLKPLSMNFLLGRINALTMDREMFMVTTDYIGPDRPIIARRSRMQVSLVRVPNPVQAKALGGADAAGLQQAIDRAAREVNERKLERHALSVAELVETITLMYASTPVDQAVLPLLDRLRYVSEDISRRLIGTRYAHIGELCLSMVNLVRRIRNGALFAEPKDIQLLPKLAQAIRRAVEPEEQDSIHLARDISRTVNRS